MERRTLLKLAPAALLTAHIPSWAKSTFKTQWRIGVQQGLDACLLLGVLSGPSLQAEAYPQDRAYWLQRLSARAVAALATIRKFADSQNGLLGPQLALLASAARSDTLHDTMAAFTHPAMIKRGLLQTEFWDGEESWQSISALFPETVTVLKNLADEGFSDYWSKNKRPLIESKMSALTTELAAIDLIGTQQKYVGRRLDPGIDVYLSAFSEPHGIRIVGQRFLTSFDYPSIIVKRNAAHEIFHPFLLPDRPETKEIVRRLSADPLLRKIDSRPDKSDGYGTITGLIEEGMVQALEAIVSRRLGFGQADMGSYWREQDGGIHLFAAGAFHAMHASGFSRQGGDALSWLARAVRSGEMTGARLVGHAQGVMTAAGIQKWLP
jgi:hypothetical protein